MHRCGFRAMGGTVQLCVPIGAHASAVAAANRASAVFAEIEDAATRFRADSPWMRLNSALGVWHTVPRVLAQLAEAADTWRGATGGLFDPRILPALVHAGYRKSVV